MKTINGKRILCVLFGLTLGLFLLLYLLLPQEEFSENEKRILARPPELRISSLLSGTFSEEAENWAADHMPARNFFVGLNAYYELLSGRQAMNAIYRGTSGRLYEAPVRFDDAAVRRNMSAINDFADSVGREIDLMLVPSAGYVLRQDIPFPADPYEDDRIEQAAEAEAGEHIRFLSLFDRFIQLMEEHHAEKTGA